VLRSHADASRVGAADQASVRLALSDQIRRLSWFALSGSLGRGQPGRPCESALRGFPNEFRRGNETKGKQANENGNGSGHGSGQIRDQRTARPSRSSPPPLFYFFCFSQAHLLKRR